MKIRSSIIIMAILLLSCNLQSKGIKISDQGATPETVQLLQKMNELILKGIMFGHQDDLAYGIGWKFPNGQSDVYKVCNDYPAVFGWDLGHLEMGSAYNLDSVPFADMKALAIEANAKGGINTFSWHLNNPVNDSSAWNCSTKGTVKSILPGGEKYQKYIQWLDKLAAFFLELKDSGDKPIPVIFRPFHEQSGDWFWWGKKHCTSEEFIQLWQFTFEYLTGIKQVHNLIFAFSPAGDFNDKNSFLERYPGDQYVDILGFDIYQSTMQGNKQFASKLKEKLTILGEIAKERNKIPALSEVGYEQIPYPTWWTEVLGPAIKGSGVSYALYWRNAYNRPNHYYAPYPGQQSEKDFMEFYKLPETLFLHDINKK
jgi:mannan endo-1,4-beta-mannosidase